MNTKSQIYSIEYEQWGNTYSMHILGTLDEVTQHADALGLSEPQLVEAIIPMDMTARLN